ncbi:MAG: polysaccharide pyruvyl transferase family protein [Clostridia bacterium]|nr:polysaccharide pyruvyl transferase family protein [Clostridia bacterium]
MKIGILTFPNSPSHGASLQMFALYKTLKKRGYDVEIINYLPSTVIHKRAKSAQKKNIKSIVTSMFVKSSAPAFKKFEEKTIKYPTTPIETTGQMEELAQRYDRIIVGSDQVWNPVVTGGDTNYYLAFSQNFDQKASYAPSFGIDKVEEKDQKIVAELLNNIKYLCAREERGAEIIKELTGREVPVVIDPTMLLEKDEWEKEIVKVKLPRKKYVLFYNIKPSPALKAKAKAFAQKHGYKFVSIGGRLREFIFKKGVYPVSGIGPAEFLGLISGAEYVFTNSFHGTALSIMLEKNFYVEYSSDTNSRLTNIVKTFGLDSCVVGEKLLENDPVCVNYESVKKILDEKRERAYEYLDGVVAE